MLEQGQKRMRQHLVGAVADEHLLGGDAMQCGNGRAQPVGTRVGIQAQRVGGFRTHGVQHTRAGAVGVFVGVELDQVGQLRLLARHIGRQVVHHGTPIAAHRNSGHL